MLDIFESFASIDSPLFILIEINIVIASLGIILFPRIIYAALCLAFVFINIALLYLLLNAEFLAAAQVLIYVGAINVLIIFAIMLVNLPATISDSDFNLGKQISAIAVAGLFSFLAFTISNIPFSELFIHNNSTIQQIGTALLQDLLLPFELLSLLLLVALVGAITIAQKESQAR